VTEIWHSLAPQPAPFGENPEARALVRMLLPARAMVALNPALMADALPRVELEPARLERLFADHYRFVWRTLRRLGVQEAAVDDAAQQVFIVASQRLADFAPRKEAAFLLGVAVRIAANARRAQTRRREDSDPDAIAELAAGSSPEELLDWKQRRKKLDDWLAALSLELRAPFVLFELEGLGVAEIASLLELPVGTVKSRLRRARGIFLDAAGAETGGAR
jgi:RNA polymerase sigma-70 factor, ECF subfamily